MTKNERILYDQAMITKTDIEYGKEYSFRKGKVEGKAEGIAEGKAKEKAEVAKKLLEAGVDISVIQFSTGLSAEEIQNI